MSLPDIMFEGTDLFIDPDDLSAELVADLRDCGRPGQRADEAVEYVMRHYDIQGDPDDCRAFLRGYGAWDDIELEDHDENLRRLIWLTGCSFAEFEEAYFSAA